MFPGITVFSKLHIFLAGVGLALLHRVLAPALTGSRLILGVQIGLLVLCLLAATVPAVYQRFFAGDPHDPLINAFYGDARRVMFAALIVFAFSFETALADALFANRLMRQLGAYSYSIYLLHGPVLWSLERAGVFARTGPTLGFVVALLVIYLVGWLSFTLVERPSQRRLRKPLAARLEALTQSWFPSAADRPATR
jgi:peptidoglycan/LPS O-acetylase OafA/YrhL